MPGPPGRAASRRGTLSRVPRAIAFLVGLTLLAAVGCAGGDDDPRCLARQALRDAVRAVEQAEIAENAGDDGAVGAQIDEAERLIRSARGHLSPAATTSIERGMLEAAEYLDFVVGSYRSSGAVDGSLATFASRELNRAPAPGERPLGC